MARVNLNGMLGIVKKHKTLRVSLPRFNLEQELKLTDHLRQLGMNKMFDTRADFSGMVENPGFLFVSQVAQKTCIEVAEEGHEAAGAAAAVTDYLDFMPRSRANPLPEFICNHPFMFIIKDKWTDMVLFTGRVVNPSK